MSKMFAHPYQLLKELVCKNFKVVLISMVVMIHKNYFYKIKNTLCQKKLQKESGKYI